MSRTTRIKRSALDTLARIFETLEGRIQAQWLPKLVDLTPTPTGAHAHIVEYGCGHYGCVFPTLDPNVVLKVTEDDTEAEFAAHLSTTIAVPICTTYYDVIEVPRDQVKHPTFLLWREAASHVGGIEEMVDDPDEALRLIRQQHVAAQHAFDLIHRATERGTDPDDLAAVVEVWVDTCVEMATQTAVPELAPLGAGLVDIALQRTVLEALRAAGVPAADPAVRRALAFVRRCQQADGAFCFAPSPPFRASKAGFRRGADGREHPLGYGTATADGLRALLAAGAGDRDPGVVAAREWLLRRPALLPVPGLPLDAQPPVEPALRFYWFATRSAVTSPPPPRAELLRELAARQRADGSFAGEPGMKEDEPLVATCHALVALAALLRE